MMMINHVIILTLIPFYFLFIFHDLTAAETHGSWLPPYIPRENITINCGSSGSISAIDHRIWQGDVDSVYFPSDDRNKASMISKLNTPTTQGSSVPYETARFSRFDFTYTFRLSSGQKFIRLYFYPNSYQNFDSSKAFFSVKAEHYTLLRNFTPSLPADGDLSTSESIVKEFCLNVEEGKPLSITFSPISTNRESFAFINRIEVISMPNNLYYTNKDAIFVGQQSQSYPVLYDQAMEVVYRINVGGALINPVGDTCMFRRWDPDDDYVTDLGWSVLPVDYKHHELRFSTSYPAYIAPSEVYWTARSMGNNDRDLIKSYNLTWEFPVDSGFDYLLRLHFCEIEPKMSKTGDRVFLIYIANQTVESQADVIQWSGGKYAPVYKDYVVALFGKGSEEKKINLSIALQANPNDQKSSYADAILNGVEIMKLSNHDGNLAGLNYVARILSPPTVAQLHTKKKNGQRAIVAAVSGVVCGIFLVSLIGFLIFRRVRKVNKSSSDFKSRATTTWWGPNSSSTMKSTNTLDSSLPSDLCRCFSLAEIKIATNNFDDVFIIGRGGFGNVYKGYIDNRTKAVAIKRLKPESSQGAHEFKTEIEMLSQLRHLHLVSLIGYCNDDREMILVYEHMPRGTLREHLYNSDNPPLSWKQRLQICIGAAHGLHYLHTGAKHIIIHRDVKTTNVLIDDMWNAKVSDFGLSRIGPTGISKTHVSTVVKGSLGYLDPEYYRRQQLTEKSDVYSFGVVLCEVLCARPPLMRSVEKKQMNLAEWARSCYVDGKFHEIVDEHLRGKIAPECLNKYAEIAMSCIVDNGNERPSMKYVVWGLEFALQLQQSAEENMSCQLSGSFREMKENEDEVPFVNSEDDDGEFTCSWESTSGLRSSQATKTSSDEQSGDTKMCETVFSQIKGPKGR
ncbi:receptor-like protein kinase FERONIA [Ziziphus jujuba]|uniref:Receptor-like protein kinase FERONIA n=1 Tax=Ziziphus jujuba TaxID=326968 RepID=A0ABM3IF51_ZIZJJ|nr:receptor-like protein kinase FERONIA [Ziziphus jujuba]